MHFMAQCAPALRQVILLVADLGLEIVDQMNDSHRAI